MINPIKLNFSFLLFVFMLFFSIHLVGQDQNCKCNPEIKIIVEQCGSQNQKTDLGFYIYDPSANYSESKWIAVFAGGLKLFEKEVFLSDKGFYSEQIEYVPSDDTEFLVEYHCKRDICYKAAAKTLLTMPNYQIVAKDLSCYGINSGEVHLNSADPNVNIVWQSGEKKNTVKNLSASNYKITIVNDHNLCQQEKEILISSPTKLNATPYEYNIACDKGQSNYLKLNVAGGTKPYFFDWDVDGLGDVDDENIVTYTTTNPMNVIVKDANGCQISKNITPTIDTPKPYNITNGMIMSSISMENGEYMFDLMKAVDIIGGDIDQDGLDGSLYSIKFYSNDSDADNNINPLSTEYVSMPGNQVVAKVENANNCIQKSAVSLLADSYCLLVSEACDNSKDVKLVPVTCTSSKTPLAPGGIYEAFIYNSVTLAETAVPQCLKDSIGYTWFMPKHGGGNYRIYYTIGGVRLQAFFDVQALNPQVQVETDPICGNVPSFEVRVNPKGGSLTGPGIFGSVIIGSNEFFKVSPTGLIPGQTYNYFYTYSQTNLSGLVCVETTMSKVTIADHPSIDITPLPDRLCELERISLDVNVTSSPSVTYQWFAPGENVPFSTVKNAQIDDIQKTGYYKVLVTQANNCFAIDSEYVEVIPLPKLKCDVNASVSCFGGSNASAFINVLNATDLSGYTFDWGNGITGQSQTALTAGTYLVTVTNERNCPDTCSISIKSPSKVIINCTDQIQDVECYGRLSGANMISVSGGVAPFQFKLNNASYSTLPDFNNLGAGTYKVFVIDFNNCLDSCEFIINQPDLLSCSIQSTDLTCYQSGDGQATVIPTGGVPLYTYLWSNGATTATVSNLSAGSYFVTTTDANSCTAVCSINITQPIKLQTNLENTNVCLDLDTFILSNPSGGTGPYTYLWSLSDDAATIATQATSVNIIDGIVDQNRLDFTSFCLKPGKVTFYTKVTDSKGCMAIDTSTISMASCFDLAIRKRVAVVKTQYPGDLVEYNIEIFNQGTIDAKDLVVRDYLDDNMEFRLEDNTIALTGNEDDWIASLSSLNSFETVCASLPAGQKKTLKVFTRIKSSVSSNFMENFAEIVEYSSELENGKIKHLPIDQDDYIPDTNSSRSIERDDEICDSNPTLGECPLADDPNDEDRLDYAVVTICQLEGTSLKQSQCTTSDLIVSGFAFATPTLKDQMDPSGNGDGIVNGDDGNLIQSFHNTYLDAMEGKNAIKGKIKFAPGNGGINSGNGKITGSGDLIIFSDQEVEIFGRLVAIDQCVAVSSVLMDFTVTPVITANLENVTTILDDVNVCLEVIADPNLAASLSYQWQTLENGTFIDIPNATKDAYCIDVITPEYDRKQYRVLISDATATNKTCSAVSAAATIEVDGDPILACVANVNVSLDENCLALITPAMILQDARFDNRIRIEIRDENGNLVSNPVNSDYVDHTLTVSVIDILTGNSCWSHILIQDKFGPVIECPDDYTVSCANYTYNPPIPSFYDACDPTATIKKLKDEFYYLDCEASELYIAIRELSYQATDSHGNVSPVCTFRVYYQKLNLSTISYPADVDLVCSPTNSFSSWDINHNNYPDPSETGYPKSGFFDLANEVISNPKLVSSDNFCKVNVTFSDQKIDLCGHTFKVVREWVILEWCSGAIEKHLQFISVKDKLKPSIACTPSQPYIIQVAPHACTADFVIPAPQVTDCNETTWTVSYLYSSGELTAPQDGYKTDDVVFNGVNYYIVDLPAGYTWIKYTVKDACDNESYCFTHVQVIDKEIPVPVCDAITVISLEATGKARLFANSIDDGSHDNCSKVTFGLRRMNNACGIASDAEFVANYNGASYYTFVDFCCSDQINNSQQVELLVIDASGNMNTCMTTVEIQQKTLPILTCPSDVTLDCASPYTPDALHSFATFTAGCNIYNVSHSDTETELTCGEKNIVRLWAVRENGKTNVVVSCTQKIYIRNLTPFDLNSVVFPSNVTLTNNCNIAKDFGPNNPATGGYPTWNKIGCSQVAASYSDQVFEVVEDACFKIVRDWTVIDWCTFDLTKPSTIKKHQQIIKVIDTVLPTAICDTKTFYVNSNCNVSVAIKGQGTDSCTPEDLLSYKFAFDSNNDGNFETTADSRYFNQVLTSGTFSLRWTVEDKCGNISTCVQSIIVKDTIKPSPYCISEIVTVLMPSTLSVALWAKDYNLGASDNCTSKPCFTFGGNSPVDLTRKHYYKVSNGVSIESTEYEYLHGRAELWDPVLCSSARIFTCEDEGINDIRIYVWDAAGNSDYCTVKIKIQDNSSNCGLSRKAKADGEVQTILGTYMQDVTMTLEDLSSGETVITKTNLDGEYLQTGLTPSTEYQVNAEKQGDYLNGVSTLDLVLIQRHILGIEKLTNPYLIRAADVNNDGKITATDLVELRKLILGQTIKLAHSPSWQFFIPGDANVDPWSLSSKASFTAIEAQTFTNDFIGVKMGDVNKNAVANAADVNVDSRSSSTKLVLDNHKIVPGSNTITVRAGDLQNMLGLQIGFTISDQIKIESISSGILDVKQQNYFVSQHPGVNVLNFSWNTGNLLPLDPNDVLFTIQISSNIETNIADVLSINDTYYNETVSSDFSTTDVEIRFVEAIRSVRSGNLRVYQNVPNPFSDLTTIRYYLPMDEMIDITITDDSGKLLLHRREGKNAGNNELVLSHSLFENRYGVFLVNVRTATESQTVKIIHME